VALGLASDAFSRRPTYAKRLLIAAVNLPAAAFTMIRIEDIMVPLGFRFSFNFFMTYFFLQAYLGLRFSENFRLIHMIWLVSSSVLLALVFLMFFWKRKLVVPATLLMGIVLCLELLSLFGVINFVGPEGTPFEVAVLYVAGLLLSIAGMIHPSTRRYLTE
jgi:hypothetical protein